MRVGGGEGVCVSMWGTGCDRVMCEGVMVSEV